MGNYRRDEHSRSSITRWLSEKDFKERGARRILEIINSVLDDRKIKNISRGALYNTLRKIEIARTYLEAYEKSQEGVDEAEVKKRVNDAFLELSKFLQKYIRGRNIIEAISKRLKEGNDDAVLKTLIIVEARLKALTIPLYKGR